MKKIFTFFIASLFFANVFAQVGTDCSNPYLITSLPFNLSASSDSTSNNYTSICGSDYSSQNDFVFEYTPSNDIYFSATTSNTGLYTGLFVTDGCPDVGTCVDFNEAGLGNPVLNSVFLQGGVTYYIIISNDDPTGLGLITSTEFTLDIIEIAAFDAGVSEITAPISSCSLGLEDISILVTNFGADSIYSFNVAYTIDGGFPVIENISDTILPGDTYTYTFNTQYDFSSTGTYLVAAYTLLSSDADITNDISSLVVNSIPVISSFPYEENFDGANSYWFAEGLTSTWMLGSPSATIINSAASAPNSWVTNLLGNHSDYESSTLHTPCFDFTSLANPIIEFDIWAETQNILTSVSFEYSVDGGTTWTSLAIEAAGVNWDNPWTGSTGAWVHVSNSVPSLASVSDIMFRYNFAALSTGYEGVAIDNFVIRSCDLPDPVAGFTYVITNDTHVEFTNTSTDATSYSWDFGDFQTDINENTSHDYLAIDNTYTVVLTASNECGSSTSSQVINIVITNINTIDNQEFVVYPNPAIEYINIKHQAIGTIYIYNINGTVLLEDDFKNNKRIDISSFNKGLYFIKIRTENNIVVRKISFK